MSTKNSFIKTNKMNKVMIVLLLSFFNKLSYSQTDINQGPIYAVQANDLLTDASLSPAASLPAASLGKDASLPAASLTDASLGKDASLPAASLSPAASLPAASLTAASLQTNAPPPAQVDATQQAAQQEAATQQAAQQVTEPEQVESAPQVVAATKAVPVDANYSAILGAFVHGLAELYEITDNAKIEISPDKVSAAIFTSTLEANNEKLTVTLTPVNSTGTAALEAIKLKIEAPKPAVVSAVEAVDASAVQKPAVETEAAAVQAVQATTSPALVPEASETEDNSDAAADKAAADKAAADKAAADKYKEKQPLPEIRTSELPNDNLNPALSATAAGGYRRRKRNLRTIKKQQQRNRRTMNKH